MRDLECGRVWLCSRCLLEMSPTQSLRTLRFRVPEGKTSSPHELSHQTCSHPHRSHSRINHHTTFLESQKGEEPKMPWNSLETPSTPGQLARLAFGQCWEGSQGEGCSGSFAEKALPSAHLWEGRLVLLTSIWHGCTRREMWTSPRR